MPRLSVLMPVKDGMPYIAFAVRSTLRALPSDSELLVLDDASRDGTALLLHNIKDPRMRVIHNAQSNGVASGLNRMIAESDSEYVARMDADDICLPWRFVMQQHYALKSDFVFSSTYSINHANIPIRPDLPGRISSEAMPLHLLVGNCVVHPTMYATRAALVELSNYRSTSAEDYDLWLRAALNGRTIVRTAEPALLYRRHVSQVSATGGWVEPDFLLDESFGALARKVLGFTGDASLIRRAGARRSYSELDQELRAAYANSLRSAANCLSRPQRALLNFRLKATRLG